MNTNDLKNPYYCKCHKIFLDKEYIERKQCLNRLSADMMCRNRCFHIIETKEYDIKRISGNLSFKKKEDEL